MREATRNRLKIRHVDVKRLVPWEGNPRKHERAIGAVAKSIRQFGFNVPILCDTGFRVIAGHVRLEAAKRVGMEKVPVAVLPLKERDCKLFAVAENKTGELADWDMPKLRDVLDDLRREDCELGALGFSPRELHRLLRVEQEKENTIPEPPAKVRTRTGTLWRLGRHRLLCGDSRHKKTFARLLGKVKVDHIFAGPPYFNQRAYSHWDDYTKYLRDMDAVMARCHAALKNGGIVVWHIGNGSKTNHAHVIHHGALLEENGLGFVDMIAWSKSGPCFSVPRHIGMKRVGCYYPAHQWECLLVYQSPGPMPKMDPEAAAYMWEHNTDTWEIPVVTNQVQVYGHPAVCPVEIPYRTLLAYSAEDNTVLDPFGGAGTTVIAAERAGQKALVAEKNPQYCDQIVKRWEAFTGKRARREET